MILIKIWHHLSSFGSNLHKIVWYRADSEAKKILHKIWHNSPYSGTIWQSKISSHHWVSCFCYFLCKFWKKSKLTLFFPSPSLEHIVCGGQYLARGSTFSQHKLNIESPDWHNLAQFLTINQSFSWVPESYPPKAPQLNLWQLLQLDLAHIDTVLHCTSQNVCCKTTWPGNPLKDKILIWQNILYQVLGMSTQYNLLYHMIQYFVFTKNFNISFKTVCIVICWKKGTNKLRLVTWRPC